MAYCSNLPFYKGSDKKMLPVVFILYCIILHFAGYAAALLLQIVYELSNNEEISKDRFMEIMRFSEIWEIFILGAIYSGCLKLISRCNNETI